MGSLYPEWFCVVSRLAGPLLLPRDPMQKKRLLIFIVAYYAESTLEQVLDRIPRSLFDEFDCEILVIDDASKDRTLEIGRSYRDRHTGLKLRVLRNELNQGYGGNQKLGYTYAIQEKFDVVVLLHGDAQYAPEELPRMCRPVAEGEAEALFGSRMMVEGAALKGGMPLYKFVGNKILTAAQNAILGTKLSEFHSGYRAYAVSALSRIPFHLNSNDFHFDTEIIIQLVNLKARIAEIPIPTYYGDEICRVDGLRYAKDVMLATLKNAAHKRGVLYQRRFDVEPGNAQYDLKLGYASSHTYAVDAVPAGTRVIDIGGGPGEMARQLADKGCDVRIVDQFAPAISHPKISYEVTDLDAGKPIDVRDTDCILLLDIIEHLSNPEAFLDQLRTSFDFRPRKLVLSTPNIAFLVQRLQLLLGQFNYGKVGILDITHKRLFTFRGLKQLLDDAGFKNIEIRGVPAPFPKVLGTGLLGRTAVQINLGLIRLSPTLFSYQIFVTATGTPTAQFVLEDTKRREWGSHVASVSVG